MCRELAMHLQTRLHKQCKSTDTACGGGICQKAADDLKEVQRLDPGNEDMKEVQQMMSRLKRGGRASELHTYSKMFSTASS